MKIQTDAPFLPQELEVDTDVQIRDASLRQAAGIRITITWIDRNGDERGMVHFISEETLAG